MEVRFRSRWLERCFEQEAEAIRTWGPIVGRRYVDRITVIQDASDDRALYALRRLDFHPLSGDRQGQYALRLTGRWRLIVTIDEGIVHIEEVSSHYGD